MLDQEDDYYEWWMDNKQLTQFNRAIKLVLGMVKGL